jgi:hypothetical protein
MQVQQVKVLPRLPGMSLRVMASAALLWLTFTVTGCQSSLHDSVLALDAETAPLIDQAAAAYQSANALYNLRVDYEAETQFDAKDPVYNPRTIEVLLSEKDIASRLAALQGFQVYVKLLCAITSGTAPKELDEASTSVGGQLSSLVNTLAPSLEKAAGIASASGAAPAAVITPEIEKGISTAMYALGKFLASSKVKKELPGKIAEMDPHLQALATALVKDVDVLQAEERRDYDRIINLQTLFVRQNDKQNDKLDADRRRAEIMKLPGIVRKQRAADERLTNLRAALVDLAKAHGDLTREAQSKNPESFKKTLEELATAASELGTFYSSAD